MRTQILYVAVLSLLVGGAMGASVGGKAVQAETEDRALATLCKRFALTAKETRDLAEARALQEVQHPPRFGTPHRERNEAIRDALDAVERMVCVSGRK